MVQVGFFDSNIIEKVLNYYNIVKKMVFTKSYFNFQIENINISLITVGEIIRKKNKYIILYYKFKHE